MVVDEEVQVGNVSEGNSLDVEGADDDPRGGNDDQAKEVGEEEEEEVKEPPVFDDVPDDEEELEDRDGNGKGEKNEGQPQGQTLVTLTIEVIPEGIRASTRTTRGPSLEELAALKQSQPLEYLKAMLSRRDNSSERSVSTSTAFEDESFSRPVNEALLKIKEKIFKGDLFLLSLADPSAPLSLKALLSQVNLLDVSSEVANTILELDTMIEQVVKDNKLLP